ncbi:SAM-dependent methyltransferase [Altericista sp. CCNU0014]|uniref:SAM-dependent methyltransferase n=1 Tax=Altericista sp. CCNU0014 TaxID=3082949 RepID=UPI00384E9CBC
MAMKLDAVVPFGRSLDEYTRMFDLTAADLSQRILGVGDGPASFNAEATQQCGTVISVDPIYCFTGAEILQRFDAVVDDIIGQVKATAEDYVWQYHKSPEDLRHNREQVIRKFLADYDEGKRGDRYRTGELPTLNFPDRSFDLGLCSHLLFLYSEHLDYAFHRSAILEMLRVSQEVRIFPLLTLMLERSPHLDPLLVELRQLGYRADVVRVTYELQKGGNEMLVVRQ